MSQLALSWAAELMKYQKHCRRRRWSTGGVNAVKKPRETCHRCIYWGGCGRNVPCRNTPSKSSPCYGSTARRNRWFYSIFVHKKKHLPAHFHKGQSSIMPYMVCMYICVRKYQRCAIRGNTRTHILNLLLIFHMDIVRVMQSIYVFFSRYFAKHAECRSIPCVYIPLEACTVLS